MRLRSSVLTLNPEIPFDTHTLYFLAFNHEGHALSAEEKNATRRSREGQPPMLNSILLNLTHFTWIGLLELTHYNTDPEQAYASGNDEGHSRGFGHLALSVDDVAKACERFERMGVRFKKKVGEGKGMEKGLAFILDPDG